jgi:hypothetical protein
MSGPAAALSPGEELERELGLPLLGRAGGVVEELRLKDPDAIDREQTWKKRRFLRR